MTDKNSIVSDRIRPGPAKGVTNNPNGRTKGTPNKISGRAILQAITDACGQSYAEQLAQNYVKCLNHDDRPMIAKYDQLFLNKVVADKQELDITTNGESINERRSAFAAIVERMRNQSNTEK